MSNVTTTKNVRLKAGEVRFSYASVFQTKLNVQSGKKTYSISFLIPKTNETLVKLVKTKINEAIEIGKQTKWNGKLPSKFKHPLKDGDVIRKELKQDDKPDKPEYKGMYILGATNQERPIVLDAERQPITDESDFYSGCYGNFIVDLFPYDNVGVGVSASLQGVMKTKDGEKLAGNGVSEKDFEDFGKKEDSEEDSEEDDDSFM